MIHLDLSNLAWTVRAVGDLSRVPEALRERVGAPLRAVVPGCVHEDLIRGGVIRDPRVGMNEEACAWVGWQNWRYEAEFDVEDAMLGHEVVELVCECLDTIASIEINGLAVGQTASEFIPWRFEVGAYLKNRAGGERNAIAITFKSPLRHVMEESARLGARPVNGEYPSYNMVRKCASGFEWDWGPRVAGCGIAGRMSLMGWSVARFDQPRIELLEHGDIGFTSDLRPPTEWEQRAPLTVGITITDHSGAQVFAGSRTFASRTRAVVGGFFSGLEPWYPHTLGASALGRWRSIITAGGRLCDEWSVSLGVRHGYHVAFPADPQVVPGVPVGNLVVNDQTVFCLGANWIPEGLFPSDRTPEKVRERLQAAKECGMNMIRIWGGGRYEPDWFYDICDELGLMVWQDFMFACACYPEEEPLWSLVEAEARHQVARLSRHPSVVLWCGGNENHWAYQSWGEKGEGFRARLKDGQTWGHGYWHELLPRIIAEVDPSRPYWPDSPWSGVEAIHPNDTDTGDRHSWDVNFWDVWSGAERGGYQKVVPRFCSEFGQQSPSNWATLKEAGIVPGVGDTGGSENALAGDPGSSSGGPDESWSAKLMGSMLARRQRGPGGNRRWYDGPIDATFRRPRDFDEWHYAAQVIQARALRVGVEWHRCHMSAQAAERRCGGVLVWQLNDAWPGLSWSLIDSAGRKKPAWYAVRAAMRPRILSIHRVDGELVVFAVNDTGEEWRPKGTWAVRGFGAEVEDGDRFDGPVIPARSAARVATVVGSDRPARHAVFAQCDGLRAEFFELPDRELEYPADPLRVSVDRVEGGVEVRLEASALARDIVLAVDGVDPDAQCDDQMFTMPAGERRTVRVRTAVTVENWTQGPPVFVRCANGLGGGGEGGVAGGQVK